MTVVSATMGALAGLNKQERVVGVDHGTELMVAFREGDEEAFVKIYEQYRDRLVNYARRLLGDVAKAEEATQDVFLKLYRARDRYTVQSKFSTFLYRIATNHCLNLRARHEHRYTHADDRIEARSDDAATKQEDAVSRKELRSALRGALAELPDNQSAALVMCHYQGLSYREASDVLEVSESAVKSLVHRARQSLMKTLEPWMQEVEVSHA